jgi:hypothetical protein
MRKKILVEEPEGKRPLGRPRRRWWVILKWILAKSVLRVWIGFVLLRMGPLADSCERGNEPSGSIKGV